MSSIRYKIWVSHSGPKGASILPKLKSPPSTVEAFRENVKRAHFQACICNLYCNRIHQSWIHMSLDGHPKDHQVHIAQCHYQVKLKLPLQIYLSWPTAAAAVTGHAPRKDVVVHMRSWLVHCSATVKAAEPATIPILFP